MKLKSISLILLLTGILIITGCTKSPANESPSTNFLKSEITIFTSSSCGCCEIYSQYIEGQGFDANVIKVDDVSMTKDKYDIPTELRSCHTTVIDDYYVEGHVPVEAIEKLLKEKPDVAGISLPDMPSGSPGMPGAKTGPFIIYAVHNDGSSSEFMIL